MPSPRTTLTSRRDQRGFSLIELLVATLVAGVALTATTTFFAKQMVGMREMTYRVEAQQALRASLDTIGRDIRLAGACLSNAGQFIPLAGVNAATDQITITTGLVHPDMSCIITTSTVAANAGQTAIQVADVTGFSTSTLAYIKAANGGSDTSRIASIAGNTITLTNALSQNYLVGTEVDAIDERRYSIDTSLTYPRLMLTVNRGAPQAFAAGISDLQMQYLLNRNCPTCDIIDLPPDTATWRLVNEVLVSATVTTIGARTNVSLTEATRAKPRNLLQ